LFAALWLVSLPARAQSVELPTLPTAQALYNAATKEMDAGDYASACPKLEEVVRLVPEGLGAKLTLAKCYEGAGKLASAWTLYSLVESAAREKERAQAARTRAAALRPRLAELTIAVPADVRALPGLEVRRDAVVLGSAQWGVAIPVDRGTYVLTAIASGKKEWKRVVPVEADGAKLEVAIGPLEDAVARAPAKSEAASQGPVAARPKQVAPAQKPLPPRAPQSERSAGWPPVKTAGVAALGVGGAGLALGVGAGVAAIVQHKTIAAKCPNDDCPPGEQKAIDDYRLSGTLATVGLAAGGAVMATGVVLMIVAPKAKPAREAAVRPLLGLGFAGAEGTF
jgi:hypothetical protein